MENVYVVYRARTRKIISKTALMAVKVCSSSILIAGMFTTGAKLEAQQQTAQVNGRIVDSTGAGVPDAMITISDPARGFVIKVKSGGSGDYTVPLLQPAEHYQIKVEHAGFKDTVEQNIVLQVAQIAKIDVTLQIGGTDEVVTVTTAPPQLDSQTSSIGQVITGQTVQDLPLNGRSTFRLIALTPGVTFNQSAFGQFGDVAVNTTFDTNFSINGGRAQSNEFLIDGVPSSAGFFDQITTLPTVDDTDQFKVEANNLSAQYGRYAGGVINVSTKSGTNGLHGDAYEFFRNSALDANDWFIKRNGGKIPPFKLNIFGGTLGGPLFIPKLYNGHDRTFYFLDYQGARRIKGSPYSVLLPTDDQKNGIFTSNIFSPFSYTLNAQNQPVRKQFNYNNQLNRIDPALFDPVALQIQKYFPKPNIPLTNGMNYQSAQSVRLAQDIFSTRIDQNVSQKYHLFGRYAYSNSGLTQPNQYGNIADAAGAVGTTSFKNQSFAFDNIYTLKPSLTLSVDYGFARWYQTRKTLSFGFDNGTLGFPSAFVGGISIPMFPTVNIAGYGGTNGQSFLSNGNDSHAILASLTKTAGHHNLVLGVDGRFHKINFFNVGSSAGTFGFAKAQTQGPVATVAGTTGDAYASFLLGFGNSGSIPIGSGVRLIDYYGAVYIQDNWRVNEKLTLNLGVRYDGESPYSDTKNHLSYFDPNVSSPVANATFPNLKGGLQYAGVGGHPSNVYTRQHNNVAPRLGFAYSPQPSTVLRGGGGISFAPLEITNNAVGTAPNLGYASSTNWNTTTDGYTPVNLLRNPYPQGLVQPKGNALGAGTQLGQALTVYTNTPPTPRSYQWNLDVQQQMSSKLVLDIGYVGSRGLYLAGPYDENTLDPKYLTLGTALTTPPVNNPFASQITIGNLSNPTIARRQLLLPFPQFLSVMETNRPYGSSTYHSAQVKLVQRETHGLTMLVSYTWSKSISNINASAAAIGSSNGTAPQNYYDLRAERGVSEIDIPQNLTFSTTYRLPFGRGGLFLNHGGAISNKLTGGYKVNAIWTELSGFPLTFSAPITGISNGRPNLTSVDPVIRGSRSNTDRVAHWFNNSLTTPSFVIPPAYRFGTVGRTYTAVRAPGVQNVDASLIKDTKFEHLNAEFRAEFFNLLNNPHFAAPNTTLNTANFGSITGLAISPPVRELQFALKLEF